VDRRAVAGRLNRFLVAVFVAFDGLLAYALLIPIIALMQAGLARNDWLFCLCLAALGTGLPLYAALSAHRSRLGWVAGLGTSCLALVSGLYLGVVFWGTPVRWLFVIGLGLCVSGLFSSLLLLIYVHLPARWIDAADDRIALIALLGCATVLTLRWAGPGNKMELAGREGPIQLSF
jgi:hypothetical protein